MGNFRRLVGNRRSGGTGVVLVIAGGALVGEGAVATATGPGAVVGIPSIVVGGEAIGIGVASTGAGFWLFYETVWSPVKEAIFGP